VGGGVEYAGAGSRIIGDHVVIAVYVQLRGAVQFGGRCDHQVRDRPPAPVAATS
jgi:hypothetical protein